MSRRSLVMLLVALAAIIFLIATLASARQAPQGRNKLKGVRYVRTETSPDAALERATPHAHNQEAADTPHVLAASYYSLTDDIDTTLTLNNKAPHPTETRLTLFSLTGTRLDAGAITVEGNSFRVINPRDYVGNDAAFREGSL